MFSKTKKILSLIISIVLLALLFACDSSESSSIEEIDDFIVLQEEILYEEIIYEGLINEGLIYEELIKENRLYELIILESVLIEEILYEDILLENLLIEIFTIEELEYYLENVVSSDIVDYDIDWTTILGKYAAGSSIILVTGFASLLTSSTPIGFAFTKSFQGAVAEAFMGAAIGGAINAFVDIVIDGNEIESVVKYALEGSADGFMWGAITGASLGFISGNFTAAKGAIYGPNKEFIGVNIGNNRIVNSFDDLIGTVGSEGFVLDDLAEVVGKIKDGVFVKDIGSRIPTDGIIQKKINKQLRSVYRVNLETRQVFDLVTDEFVGNINDAGHIYDDALRIIEMIDDKARIIPDVDTMVGAGFKLDVFGNILNKTRGIGDELRYLDDKGDVIGKRITQEIDGKIQNFIMGKGTPNGVISDIGAPDEFFKVVGMTDADDIFLSTWNTQTFSKYRKKGVDLAWADELRLVQENGVGTYRWSPAQLDELKTKGKVLGFEGHHINSALYSPTLASDPNNIKFYTKEAHRMIAHGGNYKNVTYGELIVRFPVQ